MLKQDIRFYHLQNQPAELALPALLNKALQAGGIAVRVPDARMAAQLDDHLWTYDAGSFLPHGLVIAHTADHPIVIARIVRRLWRIVICCCSRLVPRRGVGGI